MTQLNARLSNVPVSALLMAALFAFMVTHPYVGVRHDGVLYAAQALRYLDPAVFNHDPFFANGSQDQFTAFGRLYAFMISALGLSVAAKLGLLLALLSSFGAVIMLLRQLQASRAIWLGLCWLACSPLIYSERGVFSVQEGFFTARSLAEPLSLLALAAVMAGRLKWAFVLFVMGASMHPIMVLPAVVLAATWLILPRFGLRIVLPAIALALLALALILWVAGQLGWLGFVDPEWVKVINAFTPFVFLTKWKWNIWGVLLTHCVVLLLCVRWMGERVGRFAVAVLIAVVSMSAAALVMQALSIQLGVAAQLWRANWLLVLFATCLAPTLVWSLWQQHFDVNKTAGFSTGTLAVCLLASASFMTLLDVGAAAFPALLAALLLWWPRVEVSRSVAWLCMGLLAALVLGLTGLQIHKSVSMADTHGLPDSVVWMSLVSKPAVLVAIFVSLALIGLGTWLPWMMAAMVLAWFGFGWDQRDDWIKHVEGGEILHSNVWRGLPKDASVYWPESLELTWIGLRRSSYFQTQQASGVVFKRQTAMDMWRRHESLKALAFQLELCGTFDAMNEVAMVKEKCKVAPEAAKDACRPGGPDFLVLPNEVEAVPAVGVWRPSVQGLSSKVTEADRYVYSCASIRD